MVTKVLYIAGMHRNGSTLLERYLGRCAGFADVGEVSSYWIHHRAGRGRCGCGVHHPDCEFWRGVCNRALPMEWSRIDAWITMLRWPGRTLAPGSSIMGNFDQMLHILEDLYRSIDVETGEAVIIDSSKHPSYLRFLMESDSLDLRVVHLVRDPRAVAYSWYRTAEDPLWNTTRGVWDYPAGKVAAFWNHCVADIDSLGGNVLTVRYEDFCADPDAIADVIAGFAGVAWDVPPTEHIILPRTHTVSANPRRLVDDEVTIVEDERWRASLPSDALKVINDYTHAGRDRYGYL